MTTRRAYGSVSGVNSFVPAEPVRLHVRSLMAQGLGIASIARVSGVAHERIDYVLYGDSERGPAAMMLEEFATRILSVRAELDNFAGRARIDSTISKRKLQAMIAMGWSQTHIAGCLKMQRNNFHVMMKRDRISAQRARDIRDLYNELWYQRPKPKSAHDAHFCRLVLKYAESHGYVTGAAWNNIEDLNEPHPERSIEEESDIAWDEVPFLRSFGMRDADIAAAIGVSVSTLKEKDARQKKEAAKKEVA